MGFKYYKATGVADERIGSRCAAEKAGGGKYGVATPSLKNTRTHTHKQRETNAVWRGKQQKLQGCGRNPARP